MTLHRRDRRDYSSTDAALAVIVCRTTHGTHAGLMHFADDDGDRVVLHLAFHRVLERSRLVEDPELWRPAVWASPPIDSEMAEAVAALCRLVYRKHSSEGLPYAFRYIDGRFDIGTGTLVLGPDSAGLTCASFVLALLNSFGVRLLRQEEWRPRVGDEEWQRGIVGWLAELPSVSQEHLSAVESEIGCARFRPADVLAGAASAAIPIGFDEATTLGTSIQAELAAMP